MLTKLVWNLLRVTSIVFSLTFGTALAARASEEFEPSVSPPITDAMQLFSEPIELALPDTEDRIAAENAVATPAPVFQTWTDDIAVNQWSVSSMVLLEINEMNESAGVGDRMEPFQAQPMQPDVTQSILDATSYPSVESPEQEAVNVSDVEITDLQFTFANTSEIHLGSIKILTENSLSDAAIDFIALSPAETMQLADADGSIAQVTPEPGESEPEPIPEETDEPASPRWRFTFQPYGFVPLSVEGDVTVRDFSSDISLGLDDILNPLNFAAAGRFEVWRGNLGFIFDGAYFSIEQDNSISRSGLDCLDCIFPSEIDIETKVRYGQFDLGVGYRFGAVNPSAAATEFDLGPLVFDAIVGMRIYAIHGEIDLSTNLDTSRELERSKTIFEPMVSGRIRWNLSPDLAGWVRGDIAGFGIQGMVLATSFTGGLEWMFSGDTSLLLGYRISTIQYNSDDNLELDLLLHGPYLGMVFRF
jgi:hypothetical protein